MVDLGDQVAPTDIEEGMRVGYDSFILYAVNFYRSSLKAIVFQTSSCDHLSSGTSFPKYQKFPSQITVFGTPCVRPSLVRTVTTFGAECLKIPFAF